MDGEKSRLSTYRAQSSRYWNKEYKNMGWKVTHNAGSREKTVLLAKREIDLFLWPTKEKLEALFADEENNPYPTFSKDFLNHLSIDEYLDNLSEKTVLDYGCGSLARYSIALSEHFKYVWGIDISSEAINLAKKEVKSLDVKNVTFMQNDGVSINFPPNVFDFIFSNLVLQHIGNIEVNYKLASEFIRVLKPGGVMRLEYLDGSQRKDDSHAHPAEGNGITREDLAEMYKDPSVEIVSISEGFPWLWITVVKNET